MILHNEDGGNAPLHYDIQLIYSTLAYDDTPLFDAILISEYLFGNAKTTGLTNHHVPWYLTPLRGVSVIRIAVR